MEQKTIIVAGITRSGLTLTMQMLNAGGYPCLGAYPGFEEMDIDYIANKGKAIKSVDTQHQFPPTGDYYVIRLHRDLEQQSKSQVKFMQLLGLPVPNRAWKDLRHSLPIDYKKIDSWAKRQKGLLNMDFETLIKEPIHAAKQIEHFVGLKMDIEKMAECVLPRHTDCYDGMIEVELINKSK